MKHTKGPWHITEPNAINGKRFICTEPADGVFYTIAITMGDAAWSHINDAANARLIAAAPDLLSALQRAANLLARYPEHTDAWRECRAAIAKAEGAA